MEMRPATMIALAMLVALIFLPAMCVDVGEIKRKLPRNESGLKPPPLTPPPRPGEEAQANAPANEAASGPAREAPPENGHD